MAGSWKVAYADFVTAMMAFFLLMWVLNMVPLETREGLASFFSAEGTFDSNNTSPISNNPFVQNTDKIDTRDIQRSEAEHSLYAVAQKIRTMLMADAIPQNSTGISTDDVGVLLRVNSATTFAPGSVALTDEGKKVLEGVLKILEEYNLYLVIRGHAAVQEASAANLRYPSAWELSSARAASAVRFLVEHGIKPSRLRAVGYGDTRPLEPGNSAESQTKNRRIEFYFHRPEVMSYGVVY